MRKYLDYVAEGPRRWGDKFDPSDLDAAHQFRLWFRSGLRIRVRRLRTDGTAWDRTGRVSATTGYRPAFLLMHRSSDISSWDVLGPEDKIIGVESSHGSGRYVYPYISQPHGEPDFSVNTVGYLSRAQRRMLDALVAISTEPDVLHPALVVHGSGQWAAARALDRKGIAQLLPSGRLELVAPLH